MKITKRIYKLSNRGKIELSKNAIKNMFRYKQSTSKDIEGGGVLLGRFVINSKNVIVDEVSTPCLSDIRTNRRFKRDRDYHQRIIDKFWEESKGTCNYLGEWHTHAEWFPMPSRRDKESWKAILKNDNFSSRFLYFIIIGQKSIGVWEGDRRTFKIKELW